jgi:ferredoxin
LQLAVDADNCDQCDTCHKTCPVDIKVLLKILPQLEQFESGPETNQIPHDRSTLPIESPGEHRIEQLLRELDRALLGIQSRLDRLESRLLANQRQHDPFPFALPIVRMARNQRKNGA